MSADQAKTFCDQEQTGLGYNFGPKSYDQCITCYEQCGQQCIRMSGAPTTYACK